MSNPQSLRKIIDSLDWDVIAELVNKVSVIKYTKEKLQLKLDRSLNFMLTNNLKELSCDFWHIKWNGETPRNKDITKMAQGLNGNLKIFFTFMTSDTTFKNNTLVIASKPDPGETEVKILHNLLTKAIAVENYELCAVIKNRILAIIEKDE